MITWQWVKVLKIGKKQKIKMVPLHVKIHILKDMSKLVVEEKVSEEKGGGGGEVVVVVVVVCCFENDCDFLILHILNTSFS